MFGCIYRKRFGIIALIYPEDGNLVDNKRDKLCRILNSIICRYIQYGKFDSLLLRGLRCLRVHTYKVLNILRV